ncbi:MULTISPECIES: VOC family protein [Rhodopseudomonas]|uniref:3-demethylubiquinone-9 3-methyltransferase n=1 Tax=Rhodopseudomonas palustris TaxID=1076 RepID=A0A0D7DX12_RHOPL|nr:MULTISPECIES: VOC family protein [Rhodopseudomonas]KIZ33104.1 3-demethylubiquinone-9 3-methyltransferase [Rhodopseudomonas palustris]MDF3812831.1 VOC family protein [Rhodopseudomonas sp. BAL398]WOK17384.1 VOC family protein [Rhodopseudomonas sp. BAL398]
MQVNPYLFFNGNCQAAFKFYQMVLGAHIEDMLTWADAPADVTVAADQKAKIMHARLTIDGEVLMGGDAPPGRYHPPQGFAVSLLVPNPADAERRFKALAEGGSVTMPLGPTFYSKAFGMCVDRFGIPWMVNSPLED